MAAPLRRRPRDPEGRMPLREHLRELRQRILKAGLAIVLGAVGGWFLYDPVYTALQHPIIVLRGERPGSTITLNIAGVATSFNLPLRMAFYIGIVLSSPIWLYQLWAFIVPGLTKRERRRAMGFAAADYLAFVTQIMLAFGIAFVVPLLLVALNMAGVVSALTLAKGWRVAVFLCFLFSAVASPTPDAGSMLALAFPMVGLYMIAVGIAWVTDRRRARRNALEGFGALDDDEASPLAPDDAFDPHAAYDDAPGVDAGDSPHRP